MADKDLKDIIPSTEFREKLARYTLVALGVAITGVICWYFSSVLVYLLLAGVVCLVARPIVKFLRKAHVKGKHLPDWVAAVLTIIIILVIFLSVILGVTPLLTNVVNEVSSAYNGNIQGIAGPLRDFNNWIVATFPALGKDFRIEIVLLHELQKTFDISIFSSVIGSVASFLANFGIGLFSVIFIAFFFIRDESLFMRIIASFVPDKIEDSVKESIGDVEYLLSRYFVGILIEMAGVALLDFLGLALIARLPWGSALGIAFLAGILNVIPYVGPLIGTCLGTIMGLVLKYCGVGMIGLDVPFWAFALILIAIMCCTQLVDNFIYQPVIYSNSIKASPLEIFIVLLMAATLGGVFGMLVAIPCYTVLRVVAGRFFRDIKPIRLLIPEDRITQKRTEKDEKKKKSILK